ncbi:ABC transporter permease subunit [Frankia nepalensis]|uniref:ABC transporter permease subunit n=1 Tax=Frankia nepalensis TaxID=1836974 RepID=A0A937RCM1_9ACTN|nr:ABC transporter permease subunit [Frankia nepalensis]MBL7501428.1 ABC transporter permease subunit [Frankia nepalensis]MBL7510009.1 ABC transporter permease subunit [Frankia nepalensis]MBL7627980.1 ABC transporter permease subunit [Frankia nepalensis]
MTDTITPYRSTVPAARDGLPALVRAEWTKFRTVRGWVVAAVVALLLMPLFGLLGAAGSHGEVGGGPGGESRAGHRAPPTGPGGEAVNDGPYFVHRPLAGDGTVTVRVTSLTGVVLPLGNGPGGLGGPAGGGPAGPAGVPPTEGGAQPWAKAGILLKESAEPGSAYAAVMVTADHGVRLQHNFTGDTAGPPGAVTADAPRWLRLTRAGDLLTGYASPDGEAWTTVGTVRLPGLPSSVLAGLFVATPGDETFEQHLGGFESIGEPAAATATFDELDTQGGFAGSDWSGQRIGATGRPGGAPGTGDPLVEGGFDVSRGTFTLTGSGDIAPFVTEGAAAVERTLVGTFATLTVAVVLGVLFIATEYRRGLIRVSVAASPRRGRVLAAKATVIGAITFVLGLVAAAVTVPLGRRLLRDNGNLVLPTDGLTELRVVVGTAALLAVAAVLAVAVGTILRRGAGAAAGVIVLTVLPYVLAVAAVLPAGAAQWLLRITPAAGFAIQQSVVAYPQVGHPYTPVAGYFPLAPWAGFAVLCGWTVLALGLATYLLRRRDA